MRKYLAKSTLILLILIGVIIPMKKNDQKFKLSIELKVEKPAIIGLYYNDDGETFSEYKALFHPNADTLNFQVLEFELDKEWNIRNIRFDFDEPEQLIYIKRVKIWDKTKTVELISDSLYNKMLGNDFIVSKSINHEIIEINCQKGNPFVFIKDIQKELIELSQKYIFHTKLIKLLSLVIVINVLIWILVFFIRMFRNKKSEQKLSDIIFIMLFFFMISIPFLAYYFGEEKNWDEQEKRILAKKFEYDGQSMSVIIDELGTYFLDHFGLRSEMIQAWSTINYKFFGVSAIPSRVQVGESGWLYAKDYAEITQVYRFQDDELAIIRKNIEEKALWLKSKNIKFYMVLVPSKPTILFEYLPPKYLNKVNPQLMDQVVEAIDSVDNLVVIDLRKPLFTAKKEIEEDIFYKSDTHWNNWGGFYAYRYILNQINKDFPVVVPFDKEDYEITPIFDYEGDLYKSLAIAHKYKRHDYQFILNQHSFAIESDPLPNEIKHSMYYSNQDKESPKLLMIRDSYGVAIVPFMLQHFNRSVFLWNHKFEPDIVDYEKPDIFIHERLEVYIRDLLTPNDPRIIHEVDSIKLLLQNP